MSRYSDQRVVVPSAVPTIAEGSRPQCSWSESRSHSQYMSSAASTARRSFSTFSYSAAAAAFSAVTSRAVPVAPITPALASRSGTALKDRSTRLPSRRT